MIYNVSTNKFTGPLDMLLTMIEERKFSINELSLAELAGDYIIYIKKLEELPKREVSQFLVIAATLMLIKSRSLLPQLSIADEEEADIQELQDRLRQLKMFRKLSAYLKNLALRRMRMYSRDTLYGFDIGFYPPEGFVLDDILAAAQAIVARLPKEESLPEQVLERIITLEEKIAELTERIQKHPEELFKNITSKKDKIEVIVSFLAILELFKDGIIIAEQKGLFSDIKMTHAGTRANN